MRINADRRGGFRLDFARFLERDSSGDRERDRACIGDFSDAFPTLALRDPACGSPQDLFILLRLSSYWSNLFSTILTILLGLAISAGTGGLKSFSKMEHLTSDVFLHLWRRIKCMSPAGVPVHISSDGHLRNEDSTGYNPEEALKLTNETNV
ncbi:sodium-coupled monocarboxylate transporter 1 [Ixodes scapularis]